jgi:hypothetical protein
MAAVLASIFRINASLPICAASHNAKGRVMSSHNRSAIVELIGIFGNAVAAASAVRQGRQPRARDLRALGIDPEQFRRISRF